jgi:hypothetical protein
MKTRNTKGKTTAPSRTVSAKKNAAGKKSASRASAGKKGKPIGKPSAKAADKEKKPAASKKTVKKSLKTIKKSPAKTIKAAVTPKKETIKKKISPPKTVGKAATKKTAKVAPRKTSPAPIKSSPRAEEKVPLKAGKGKVPIKTKIRKTGGTKKVVTRIPKPVPSRQRRKIGGTKKKLSPGGKGKKVFEGVSPAGLPEEYGENELILMTVDPNVVFVDWEIRKEEVPEAKDGFTLRVFDVTRSESGRFRPDSFVDIKIDGRVGSGFFELKMPGREVAVEIGLFDTGKFLPILHSSSVSMPQLLVFDELGIGQKLFESGIPVGY